MLRLWLLPRVLAFPSGAGQRRQRYGVDERKGWRENACAPNSCFNVVFFPPPQKKNRKNPCPDLGSTKATPCLRRQLSSASVVR